ncbi:cation:proton antiporter [Candidatus Woesearchaeota archaeon]|nr:cation:proton antiporter [Candidatus Woesearchaeota archaeon]
MEPLVFLTNLTVLLLIGLICGVVSRKLKIPNMLLLILSGIFLSNMTINSQPIVQLSQGFLLSTSILTLVMLVFDGSSRFKLKELDTYSELAVKTVVVFLVLNLLILSTAVYFLFNLQNPLIALLFAAVMSGTDPGSVLTLFKTKSNRIVEILKFESVINTPIIVLIPFLILDLIKLEVNIVSEFLDRIVPFLQQIITGVGTGIVVGIVVFKFMKKVYSKQLSPLTMITAALLTYILAEQLGGNGVLAVTVLGVFFGNIYVKEKESLQEFSSMLSNSLEILVFILVGFILSISVEPMFILKSILLFVIMIAIRFIAMQIVYLEDHMNFKERLFMAVNCTKGIAVAVVAFMLSKSVIKYRGEMTDLILISGMSEVISLMVLFIIYSIILSSIFVRFSKKFIRIKVEEE